MKQSNIKTGFTELDEKIGGFEKGDLICIASSPSENKRILALNIMCNLSKQQIPVCLFSLDENKSYLTHRMINIENATFGSILETTRNLILLQENTYIYDNILNITDIEQTARKEKSQKNIGLIIIDYLQLIKSEQTLEDVIKRLKQLAKELDVPVIILNELESKKEKRPTLSDFNNSSNIVNYADTILLVYKDDYYNIDSEKKEIVDITVAKSKTENTGMIDLLDIKTRYVNIEKY